MGEFTVKKWRCDRCGIVLDSNPRCYPASRLSGGYYYSDGPGPSFDWKELCSPCSIKVECLIDGLMKEVKEFGSNG